MFGFIDAAPARNIAIALALTLAPIQALAQDDAAAVFAESGLDSAFTKGPETIVEIATELGADAQTTALWEDSARRTFDPDTLTERFRAIFIDALDPEAIPALLEFRRTELGQAITAAEVDIYTLSGEPYDTRRAAAEAAAETLPAERHALYDRLAELTASPNIHEHFVSLVEAILTPLLPADQVEAALAELRDSLATEPKEEADRQTIILVYESFSDAELEAFIAHLETPEGLAFLEAVALGEDQVFSQAAEALADDFAAQVAAQ
jgi:hypothetical protein